MCLLTLIAPLSVNGAEIMFMLENQLRGQPAMPCLCRQESPPKPRFHEEKWPHTETSGWQVWRLPGLQNVHHTFLLPSPAQHWFTPSKDWTPCIEEGKVWSDYWCFSNISAWLLLEARKHRHILSLQALAAVGGVHVLLSAKPTNCLMAGT